MIKSLFLRPLSIILILSFATIAIVFILFNKSIEQEEIIFEDKEAKELLESNLSVLNQDFSGELKPISQDDHLRGEQGALVEIIFYADFNCPFSSEFFQTSQQLQQEFGDKIVIAFRHFPVDSLPNGVSAALAAECSADQGKFWEMHDKLFALKLDGGLNGIDFHDLAEELDLEMTEFDRCFDEEKHVEKIYTQKEGALTAGAFGAPTIFVGEEIFPGAVPFEDYTDNEGVVQEGMKNIIERQLSAAFLED